MAYSTDVEGARALATRQHEGQVDKAGMPLVFTMNYDWKTDLGTYLSASDTFLPSDPDQEISAEYIEQVKTIVRNKIRYCEAALDHDYFRHVFSGISD